jgi:Type IV secretion system pilin
MKSFLSLFVLAGLAVAYPVSAQNFLGGGDGGEIGDSLDAILQFIDSVVIPFILSIGFLVFVWGMFKYFIQGGANDEAKESGKSLIMYAIAGYVVILAFWGIVNILTSGLGLDEGLQYTPEATVQGNI